MSYLLIHQGALATAHARGGIIPAAEVGALRSAVELLAKAERVAAWVAGDKAAAEDSGRAEGREAGLAEGRAAAAAELGAELTRLSAEAAAERARVRADIGRLALEVVRRIAGEVGSEAVVSGLAAAALERLLPDAPVVLRVPPAAAGAVEARVSGRFAVTVIAEPGLAADECVIETAQGRVQAGLEVQLAALTRAWADAA